MRTHHKELAFGEPQSFQNIRGINATAEMVQHLVHGAAGFDYPVWQQAFAQQVITGDRTVGEIDIGGVIHNAPVDLLRHPHIKTTVARFHMKCRNSAAFGRDNRHTAVGVAQHQQGFWLNFGQKPIHRDDHIANGFRATGTRRTQEVIRLADAQVLEEDFIQLEIVVLPRVHQNVLTILIQLGHYP